MRTIGYAEDDDSQHHSLVGTIQTVDDGKPEIDVVALLRAVVAQITRKPEPEKRRIGF